MGGGFPIRKSPDQSLLGGSPRLIAASHVLLRHLLPRHPPYALSSLTKMWHIHDPLRAAALPSSSLLATYHEVRLSRASSGALHRSRLVTVHKFGNFGSLKR